MNTSKSDSPNNIDSVDVVIPTFNETLNLVRAIDSIKSQTVGVNKIFVVDDGSSQEVKSFLLQKYESDDLVELVLKDHSGLPGVSRKLGVSLSSADWIAFLDADDYWAKNKLEIQLSIARNANTGFVFSNATMVGGETAAPYFESQLFPLAVGLKSLLRSNSVVNSSVIVRRSLLLQVGSYPDSEKLRGVEDYATWLRISVFTKLKGTSDCLVYYQVSPHSLSRVEKLITRKDAIVYFEKWLLEELMIRPWLFTSYIQLLLYKAKVFVDQRIDAFKEVKTKSDQKNLRDVQ